MKLLIVGSDKVFAIENYYKKYLAELGVSVSHFAAQSIFYDYYYQGTPLRKILYKIGASSIIKKINIIFCREVDHFKPDIIWIFKGMEITSESLIWAKNKGIRLVNYNPDNPFIFTGSGSGNKNITDSIPQYDLHFTYNLAIKKELEDNWNSKTAYLPFGFDVSDALYRKCVVKDEIIKACFLGNPDKTRARILNQLALYNIELDVYGNEWGKYGMHKNIKVYPPVYGDELWIVLRKYRLQLNLMRIHNEDSHNMRTFEVPGIGGIQIAPRTTEHELFFENGKEIFLYDTLLNCAELIRLLLSKSNDEANYIRETARKASLEKKYSYKDRAVQALDELNRLV